MTAQEKLVLRFLLIAIFLGIVTGYIRRTWFAEPIENLPQAEQFAREVDSVAKTNSIRYENLAENYSSLQKQSAPEIQKIININQATEEELQLLPGIGVITAEKIVRYRENFGPFKSLEDLLLIDGIGKKTVENIRSVITL